MNIQKKQKSEKNELVIQQIFEINKTIHEPARLFIMAVLYQSEEVDFLFLLNETKLSKGNIATHIKKLEEEGYIKVKKELLNKKTHSSYSITESGKECFKNYIENMRIILEKIY